MTDRLLALLFVVLAAVLVALLAAQWAVEHLAPILEGLPR